MRPVILLCGLSLALLLGACHSVLPEQEGPVAERIRELNTVGGGGSDGK